MPFPLHLPCASMWLSFRTSMGSYFECIEVANNRIVASMSRIRLVSLAVSALAGTCNVLQASTAISIRLILLQLSWCWSNEDITSRCNGRRGVGSSALEQDHC